MQGWRCVYPMMYLLILSSVAMGFDGQRKGFVMGGGAGLGVISTWKHAEFDIDQSGQGVGGNIIIGYAWNNRNMAVWQLNGNTHNIDLFPKQGIQFYTGPAWYHYFGKSDKSIFSVLGFWEYAIWEVGEGYHATGRAAMVGAGYEFSRHFQAGIYYGHAWTRPCCEDYEKHGTGTHLNILITAVAY